MFAVLFQQFKLESQYHNDMFFFSLMTVNNAFLQSSKKLCYLFWPGKLENIKQMITINDKCYLVIFSQWEVEKLSH